jgi:RNA polymerase sigma-70 factor, ECF subfamily
VTDASRALLRNLLQSQYADLVRRLTRRLGSSDAASEALHDTYLRLERGAEIGPVASPRAYLLRMAANLASNRRRADRRLLTAIEISALVDLPDAAPDPERTAQARADVRAVLRALEALPAVRRDVFLASWAERQPHAEIARRFGLHLRTVQKEIQRAEAHLQEFFMEAASPACPETGGEVSLKQDSTVFSQMGAKTKAPRKGSQG